MKKSNPMEVLGAFSVILGFIITLNSIESITGNVIGNKIYGSIGGFFGFFFLLLGIFILIAENRNVKHEKIKYN